jgi:hypothetical protein
MLRSLLLVPVLIAAIAACSPAEPPLLIDGARPPAAQIVQEPPASTPAQNEATARQDR